MPDYENMIRDNEQIDRELAEIRMGNWKIMNQYQ